MTIMISGLGQTNALTVLAATGRVSKTACERRGGVYRRGVRGVRKASCAKKARRRGKRRR